MLRPSFCWVVGFRYPPLESGPNLSDSPIEYGRSDSVQCLRLGKKMPRSFHLVLCGNPATWDHQVLWSAAEPSSVWQPALPASHMGAPSWRQPVWAFRCLQVQLTTATAGEEPSEGCRGKPFPNSWPTKLWTRYNACFKLLSCGAICYTAVVTWTTSH